MHNGTLDNQEERQSAQKMGFREQQQESTSIHTLSVDKGEQIVDSSAVLEVSFKRFGVEDELYRTTSLSEASETQDGSESVEFDMQKFTGKKIIGGSKQDQSTTILQNLFGSASKANLSGSSDFIKVVLVLIAPFQASYTSPRALSQGFYIGPLLLNFLVCCDNVNHRIIRITIAFSGWKFSTLFFLQKSH